MPAVKRAVPRPSGAAAGTAKPAVAVTRPRIELKLPTERSVVSNSIDEQIMLIYGEPGIGKSSLLNEFENILFGMFEPGVKNLSVYKLPEKEPAFSKWAEFTPWVPAICKTNDFAKLVFDTSDMAYRQCTVHVCEQNGWDHVSEAGYAKGYDRSDEEFLKQLTKLSAAGKGVFFTSHLKSEKYERANGTSYNRLMPSLQSRPAQMIVGLSDIVAYYGYAGEERRLWIGGNDFILTKCKPESNFFTPDGERIISIPMGTSHEEAFDNLMTAWNNEQEDAGGITKLVNPERRLRKAPIKS